MYVHSILFNERSEPNRHANLFFFSFARVSETRSKWLLSSTVPVKAAVFYCKKIIKYLVNCWVWPTDLAQKSWKSYDDPVAKGLSIILIEFLSSYKFLPPFIITIYMSIVSKKYGLALFTMISFVAR